MINILYFLILMLSQCVLQSATMSMLSPSNQSTIQLSAVHENRGFQCLQYFIKDPKVLRAIVLRSRYLVDVAQIEQVPKKDQLKWPEETKVILTLIGAKLCKSVQSEPVKYALRMHSEIFYILLHNDFYKSKEMSFSEQELLKNSWHYRTEYPTNSRVIECDVRQLLPQGLPAIEALSDDEARVQLTFKKEPSYSAAVGALMYEGGAQTLLASMIVAMLSDDEKSRQDILIERTIYAFDRVYRCFKSQRIDDRFLSWHAPWWLSKLQKINKLSDDRRAMYYKAHSQLQQDFKNQEQDLEKFRKSLCEKFNKLTSEKQSPRNCGCCVIA